MPEGYRRIVYNIFRSHLPYDMCRAYVASACQCLAGGVMLKQFEAHLLTVISLVGLLCENRPAKHYKMKIVQRDIHSSIETCSFTLI